MSLVLYSHNHLLDANLNAEQLQARIAQIYQRQPEQLADLTIAAFATGTGAYLGTHRIDNQGRILGSITGA